MSNKLKHMAIHDATGARCVVVCMKLDENVNSEKEYCLIVETDSLPLIFQDAFMEVVNSNVGQQANELLGILARNIFPDGSIMLETLHKRNYIQKISTDRVYMTPTNQHKILLSEVNKMLSSDKITENTKKEDIIEVPTMPTVASNNKTAEKVAELRCAAINVLKQAELIMQDARKYVVKAVTMDSDLNFEDCLNVLVKSCIPEVFNTKVQTTECFDYTCKVDNKNIQPKEKVVKCKEVDKLNNSGIKLKKDGTPEKRRGRKPNK